MSLYELKVKTSFDAAHFLRDYVGKCSHIHGHTWSVEVAVGGGLLDERGMVLDFLDFKKVLKEVTERYDHAFLNEISPFREVEGEGVNPTAENLARLIFEDMQDKLVSLSPELCLISVQIWESRHSSVTYHPPEVD
jgi:6-pyruvoyltetrahydropterin/6-carboxytetrahydropterin synthase